MELIEKIFKYFRLKSPFKPTTPVLEIPTNYSVDLDVILSGKPSETIVKDVKDLTYIEINKSLKLKKKAEKTQSIISSFTITYTPSNPLAGILSPNLAATSKEMAIVFHYINGCLYTIYDDSDMKSLNRNSKINKILE